MKVWDRAVLSLAKDRVAWLAPSISYLHRTRVLLSAPMSKYPPTASFYPPKVAGVGPGGAVAGEGARGRAGGGTEGAPHRPQTRMHGRRVPVHSPQLPLLHLHPGNNFL